ncbi:hypothetical protein L6452_38942 [Arctium lappa]|uniref:Uncharacterized protein n=1 Tax=Arctium lappa TaxID=4217 RepID=A0ACB8XSM7_ARCLA|nr:hypothetical protein L6452_38942 [Arctium lappa]
MMTISSKFVAKTDYQTTTVQNLLKEALSSEDGKLKRKIPETTCSEEAKKKTEIEHKVPNTAELEVLISSNINETPPHSPRAHLKEPETTMLPAEDPTMVVDEQAHLEEPVQKTSICIPAISIFTQPPAFLCF